jgi:hypothetical protein
MEVDVNAVKCIARKRFLAQLISLGKIQKNCDRANRQAVNELREPVETNSYSYRKRSLKWYARKPKTTNQNTRKGNSPQERKTQKEARQARAEAARHEWGLI